jgi:hypothetical protein
VTLEEIRATLHAAMPLRVPLFDPNTRGQEKISALEDHLLRCAYHRGELEEALFWAVEAGKALKAQWDGVEGHEALLRGNRPTKEQVDAARRQIAPDVWKGLDECRSLVESLRRQIVRLGGTDYDAVSRAYTLMSGG